MNIRVWTFVTFSLRHLSVHIAKPFFKVIFYHIATAIEKNIISAASSSCYASLTTGVTTFLPLSHSFCRRFSRKKLISGQHARHFSSGRVCSLLRRHLLRLYYASGFLPPEPNSLRAARGEAAFRLNFYKLQILFLLSLPPILINPLFSHYLILFHFVWSFFSFLHLFLSVETMTWGRDLDQKTSTNH